ncbi:hypothetical protein SPRA44_430023 [Serratia proteamaculans]|uniref:hypothetical protein n=1 Tax=Serratia proteamaculans TaxID=28151 RepID=UPI0009F7E8E8|nr:hypothetical protein [Serratia proteamaculans]SMB40525.1 hypothetical protein SPRA44_430023 [Serratia proteamaculans]
MINDTPLNQVKISELGQVGQVREGDTIPLNNTTTGGEAITKHATVDDLRRTLNFDYAFITKQEGLDAVNPDEFFYVYGDASKVNVLKYIKRNGIAAEVIGTDGKQISLPTNVMSNEILEIFKNDGYKSLGKVALISDLTKIEPTREVQSILVERAVEGGPLLNLIYNYDSGSIKKYTDGVLNIATSSNKVWALDVSEGVNIFVFGFVPALDNLAQTINRAMLLMVNRAINTVGTIGTISHVTIPAINPGIGKSSYVMTETLRLTSFLGLRFTGTTLLDFSGSDIDGIVVDNSFYPGATDSALIAFTGSQANGVDVISSPGKVIVKGTGQLVSSKQGLWVGNSVKGFINCRDIHISNVELIGFKYGFRHDGLDSYLNLFSRITCARNYHALYFIAPTRANAGEKIRFQSCIFSDSASDCFIFDMFAFELVFDDCSFDYNNGDVFWLGKGATHGWVKLINCHFEGFDGYLINQPDKWDGVGQKFYFINSQIYAVKATVSFGPPRQILNAPLGNFYASFVDSPINYRNKGTKDYGALNGIGTVNENITGAVVTRKSKTTPNYLISYSAANNRRYKFQGIPDEVVSATETSTGIQMIVRNGTMTVTYGKTGDDGLQSLILTATDPLTEIDMLFPDRITPDPCDMFNSMVSVKSGVSTGDVKITAIAKCFGDPTLTGKKNATNDDIAISTTYPVLGTTADSSFLLSEALTEVGTDLTRSDFICIPPLTTTLWSGTRTALIGFRVKGFTGSVEIKLPVFWKVQ